MIQAASLSLLVIVAGMFLLAKTQKENLSNFFKYVSYFVIASGFIILFGGGTFAIVKKCVRHMKNTHHQCEGTSKYDDHHNKKACSGMEKCREGKECSEGGMRMEKHVVINDHEMNGCEEGCEKPCCEGKVIKKDSVVVKR